MDKKVKVIPCSGIGKVYDSWQEKLHWKRFRTTSGKSETMCLAYIVTGDKEAKERIEGFDCITVDGCPKMCAQKMFHLPAGM